MRDEASIVASCYTCRHNRGELHTPGGVIYQDALWSLQHAAEPVPLVGWLVLKPLRHVEAFADLTPEEAASFGPLVHRITRAMTEVLRPVKVYLSMYMESAPHLHVHLIPRYVDIPTERRGADIFDYLRVSIATGRNNGDIATVERAVAAIRDRLHKAP